MSTEQTTQKQTKTEKCGCTKQIAELKNEIEQLKNEIAILRGVIARIR